MRDESTLHSRELLLPTRSRIFLLFQADQQGRAQKRGRQEKPNLGCVIFMLVSRGSIFGTEEAATHARSRHEIAQTSPAPVLVFDCEGASFDVVDGDVHLLPPNQMLAIQAEHSDAVVGLLETGIVLESVSELASSVCGTFARSVKFHARWLVAAEHGVDSNGALTAYVTWSASQSPRRLSPQKQAGALVERSQKHVLKVRANPTMAYAVAPGMRLAVLPSKWQPEIRHGTVVRLFRKGACIIRVDNGDEQCVDPRPSIVTPAALFHYSEDERLMVSHEGLWTEVLVRRCFGGTFGNRHTLVLVQSADGECEIDDPTREAAAASKPAISFDLDLNEVNHASKLNPLPDAVSGSSSMAVTGARTARGIRAVATQSEIRQHALQRHGYADEARAVLLFDLEGATLEVIEGDVSLVPASRSFPMYAIESNALLGTVLATKDEHVRFAERVRFLSLTWFKAVDHGVDAVNRSLLVKLRWSIDPASPRSQSQRGPASSRASMNGTVTLRVLPNLVYAVEKGVRLAVRSPKRPSELSSGRVIRLLQGAHSGKCVVQVDNGGGLLIVDPKPTTVELTSTPQYSPGAQLVVLHEGRWRDARVDALDDEGSGHTLILDEAEGHEIHIDLNECNHAASPYMPVLMYEERRVAFCLEVVQLFEFVTDRITGNRVLACDQVTYLSASSATSGTPARSKAKWARTATVHEVVAHLLTPSPTRSEGVIEMEPILLLGDIGMGKTWLIHQAAFHLAEQLVDSYLARSAVSTTEPPATGSPRAQVLSPTSSAASGEISLDLPPPPPPESAPEAALEAASETASEASLAVEATPVGQLLTQDLDLDPGDPPLSPDQSSVARSAVISSHHAEVGSLSPYAPNNVAKTMRGGACLPIVIEVHRLADILSSGSKAVASTSIFRRYVEHEFEGDEKQSTCQLLLQAYEMRELLILLDGIDEAAGWHEQIQDWVLSELAPSGNRLLVTSRPGALNLARYTERFTILDLQSLTNEQRQEVVDAQVEESNFFSHLRTICGIRHHYETIYDSEFPTRELRVQIESVDVPDETRLQNGEVSPNMRQMGTRATDRRMRANEVEDDMHHERKANVGVRPSLLDELDAELRNPKTTGAEIEALVRRRDGLDASTELESHQQVANALGALAVQRRSQEVGLNASALWNRIVNRTNEIYVLAEKMLPTVEQVIAMLVSASNATASENHGHFTMAPLRDPVAVHKDAMSLQVGQGFDDELPEAYVRDILGAEVVFHDSSSMIKFCELLMNGFERTTSTTSQEPETKVRAVKVLNRFDALDSVHFRYISFTALINTSFGHSIFVDVVVHHAEILDFSKACLMFSRDHEFFRSRSAKTTMVEYGTDNDLQLEAGLSFIIGAARVPLLFSMLALLYTDESNAPIALPSTELELYEMVAAASVERCGIEQRHTGSSASMLANQLLRTMARANQHAKRHIFSSDDVDAAVDDHPMQAALWRVLSSDGMRLPLLKTLSASSVSHAAQYQFEHPLFQDSLHAAELARSATWNGWTSDIAAANNLNDAFYQNTWRIGATALGTALALSRPRWVFRDENGSALTSVGRKGLAALLKDNPTLEALHVGGATVGPDGAELGDALRSTRSLQELSLCGTKIGPSIGIAVGRLLRSSNGERLTSLNLADTLLGKEGMCMLSAALRGHKSLADLDVSYNQLGPLGCAMLGDTLRVNHSLRSVVIMGEKFDARSSESIGRALLENRGHGVCYWRSNTLTLLQETHSLSTHNLGPPDVTLLAGLLKHNSNLRKVTFSNNNIGRLGGRDSTRALRSLATALKSNSGLTTVSMLGLEITDAGKRMLGNALLRNAFGRQIAVYYDSHGIPELSPLLEGIRSVRLSGLSAPSGILLAGSICGNRSLTRLELDISGGGRETALAIASALRTNSLLPLTHLALSGSPIGEEGMAALGNALLDKAPSCPVQITEGDAAHSGCRVAFMRCEAFTVTEDDTQLEYAGGLSPSAALLLAAVLRSNTLVQAVQIEQSAAPLPVQRLKGMASSNDADRLTEFCASCLDVASGVLIGGLLNGNQVLQTMRVRSNARGVTGNQPLEAMLSTLRADEHRAIHTLDLGLYGVDDKGLQSIHQSMTSGKLPMLTALDLSGHCLELQTREVTGTLLSISRSLSVLKLGAHECQDPLRVLQSLQSFHNIESGLPSSEQTGSAKSNAAADTKTSYHRVEGTFIELHDCDWAIREEVVSSSTLRLHAKCLSLRDSEDQPLRFGLGWSAASSNQLPMESVTFRAAWRGDDCEVRFLAPTSAGNWSLHVWVAPCDGPSMRLPSSPFSVLVVEPPEPSEQLEDVASGLSTNEASGFLVATAAPAPMSNDEHIEIESKRRASLHLDDVLESPWNHLQMKHSNMTVEVTLNAIRKSNWEAAHTMRDSQKQASTFKQEETDKHLVLVRRRRQEALLQMQEVQHSMEQRRKLNLEKAIQVRMEVISWREAKAADERLRAETQQRHQEARSARKELPRNESSPPSIHRNETSPLSDREHRRVRAGTTDLPPTPRLAKARAARAAAAQKLKAAAKRADDRRVSSKKKEARRLEMGPLATMIDSYSLKELASNIGKVVQAVADNDRRVRVAAQAALDKLRSCGWGPSLLAEMAETTALPLIQNVESPIGDVRKAVVDVLKMFDSQILERHAPIAVRALENSIPEIRMTALMVLSALQPTALAHYVDMLAKRLEDQNADVRRAAVSTMSRFDDSLLSRHVEAIAKLLLWPDVSMRKAVVTDLLAKLPAEALELQLETISRYFEAASAPELRYSMEVLVKLPPSIILQQVGNLVTALEDSDSHISQLAAAALNRVEVAALEPHTSALLQKLKQAEPAQRQAGLRALTLLHTMSDQYAADVVEVLDDEVADVRCTALDLLKQASPQSLLPFVSELVDYLDDPEDAVRLKLVEVLDRLDPEVLTDHLVVLTDKLGDSRDDNVRAFVVKALGGLNMGVLSQHVPAQVFAILLDDSSLMVREAAIKTLGEYAPAEIEPHIDTVVSLYNNASIEDSTRKAVLMHLIAKLPADVMKGQRSALLAHIEDAVMNLDSSDWSVRKDAAETMGCMAPLLSSSHTSALVKRLEDSKRAVGWAVCDALAKREPKALSAHADHLIKKLKEPREHVRMTAVVLLNVLADHEGLLSKSQSAALYRVGAC